MRKLLTFFTLFILLLATGILCGCAISRDHSDDSCYADPISLWVITEKSTSDGMNHQAKLLIDQFKEMYPSVTIQLDILPTEKTARQAEIERIYSLMDIGKGPDLFLLPTGDVLTLEKPEKYTYLRVIPFFKDVNHAMQQGYFLDIREFYDSDDSLNKSSLKEEVMNAGVVNHSRYTLPLRFNLPVMYVWDNYFDNSDDISNILDNGIDAWMNYAADEGDLVLACSAEYNSLQVFSNIIDYESVDVILSGDTVENYLTLYQQIQSIIGSEYHHRTRASIEAYILKGEHQFPAQISTLGHALDYAAIAQAEEKTLEMYPIHTVEGDFVATITYFIAIGAKCGNPKIAYEFARLFLLEESQWEENRAQAGNSQYNGLIMHSWPVRVSNSVAPLWKIRKSQINTNYNTSNSSNIRHNKVYSIELNNSSIPILYEHIDIARYPAYLANQINYYTSQLNTNRQSVMVSTLAEEIINDLKNNLQ